MNMYHQQVLRLEILVGCLLVLRLLTRCHEFCRSGSLLFERLLSHQVLVLSALLPVLLGVASVLDKTHHAEKIVVESHDKRSNTVKLSRRFSLVLDLLDLDDVLFRGIGDKGGAGSDPLSIDEALARATLALATTVLDELSGLNGGVSQGQTGQCHCGLGLIALLEDDGYGSLQADFFEIFDGTYRFGQRCLFLPFGFVEEGSVGRSSLWSR